MRRPLLLAGLLLAGLARLAPAQDRDARLAARLPAAAREDVLTIVDAAALNGVPTGPIVSKAMEGAAKGADAPMIVAAVRTMAGQLRLAQDVLGFEASEAEIVGAAALIRRGVTADALRALHVQRPHGELAVPFLTLGDLLTAGVHPDSASAAVLAMTRTGASDAELLALARRLGGAAAAHPAVPGASGGGASRPSASDGGASGAVRGGAQPGAAPPTSPAGEHKGGRQGAPR